MVGFGSDGASVMTGCVSGVATRLKAVVPYQVALHCMAHKLQLSCQAAYGDVDHFHQVDHTSQSIYTYFSRSCKRGAHFANILEGLGIEAKSILQLVTSRWLSRGQASTRIYNLLQGLVQEFEAMQAKVETADVLLSTCAVVHLCGFPRVSQRFTHES